MIVLYLFLIVLIFLYIISPLLAQRVNINFAQIYDDYNNLQMLRKEYESAIEDLNYDLQQNKISSDEYKVKIQEYNEKLAEIDAKLKEIINVMHTE
jgi:chromosome segregation ATPase